MSLLSPQSSPSRKKHPESLSDFQDKIAKILDLDWTRLPEAEKNSHKIQWITHIYDMLESETILPEEKLSFFSQFIKYLIKSLSFDSQQSITELRQINSQLNKHQEELNKKLNFSLLDDADIDIHESQFTQEEGDAILELNETMAILSEKRQEHLKNPDIQFLDHLLMAQEILTKKITEYTQFINDPQSVVLPQLLQWLENKKYICSNIWVFFLISEKDAPLVFSPGEMGIHFRDSIFSAIRITDDTEGVREVIYHENLHNLYEVFFDSISPTLMIRDRIWRLAHFVEIHAPQSIIDKERSLIEKSAETYIHNSKHEIIANFNELQEGSMATELMLYVDILKELRKRRLEKKEDLELCRLLQESENKLILSFKAYYNLLSDLIFVAKQTDTIKELRSGMILFKPNNYSTDLKKYVEHLIGKDCYKFYATLRKHLQNPFFKQQSPEFFHKKIVVSPEQKLLSALFWTPIQATIDPVLVETARPQLTKEYLSSLMIAGKDQIPLPKTLNIQLSSYLQNLDWYEISIDDLCLHDQEEKDEYIHTLSLFCKTFQLSVDIEAISQQIEL